jgi:hypothetical protein
MQNSASPAGSINVPCTRNSGVTAKIAFSLKRNDSVHFRAISDCEFGDWETT